MPLIFHVKKPEVTGRKQRVERQVMWEFDPNEWAIIKKSCWSKTQSALWGAFVELRNEDWLGTAGWGRIWAGHNHPMWIQYNWFRLPSRLSYAQAPQGTLEIEWNLSIINFFDVLQTHPAAAQRFIFAGKYPDSSENNTARKGMTQYKFQITWRNFTSPFFTKKMPEMQKCKSEKKLLLHVVFVIHFVFKNCNLFCSQNFIVPHNFKNK